MRTCAILAAATLFAGVLGSQSAPPEPPSPAPPTAGAEGDEGAESRAAPLPIRVRFRLADGVQVTGELTAWDDRGIDGSFGRRAWTAIDHRDVWALYLRVADRASSATWVELGRILLVVAIDQPNAERHAERAFARATQAAKEAGTTDAVAADIAAAREEAADERAARERAAREREAERLRTTTPEATAWGASPWPPLSDDDQAAAVATMRADAARMLEEAGLQLAPVETDYFLFYSDMPRAQARRWVGELDAMYARLLEKFDMQKGTNVFWGKAVIFVFNDRDRFELVEARAFGQLVPEWAHGMCHPIGPKVFVSFYRQPDDAAFAIVLVHETVHGFMHRFRTPRRLPTWANEGFADYVASILFRGSPVDSERRRQGLRWVRAGGDVNSVLSMEYDGSWPGPGGIGYSVGYLLVELMIRERPRAFGQWVHAIKDGKEWEKALIEEFGATRDQLVEIFTRFYLVND
jgi:hypothetical protein